MEKAAELEKEQYDKYGELVQACKELPKPEAKAKIDNLLAEGIIPHHIKWTENNSDTSCVEEIVCNLNLLEDKKIAWLNQLVEKGADLHVITYNGTLLHTAMIHDCQQVAAFLIKEKGLDVNGQHPGNLDTALHQQARFRGEKIISNIQFLLKHGANPLLKNKFDETPRDRARFDEIRQLLETAEEKQRLKENTDVESIQVDSAAVIHNAMNLPPTATLRQRRPLVISSQEQAQRLPGSKNAKSTPTKSANLLDKCLGFFSRKKDYQRLPSEASLAQKSPPQSKISSVN